MREDSSLSKKMNEDNVRYRRVPVWILFVAVLLLLTDLAIGIAALVKTTQITLSSSDESGIKELLSVTSVENGALVANAFATSGSAPIVLPDEFLGEGAETSTSALAENFSVTQGDLTTATITTNSLTLTSENASTTLSMTDAHSLVTSDKPMNLATVLQFQNLSTAERDAISLPTSGSVIYNSTTDNLNLYSTSWQPFGTVSGTAGQIDVTSGVISLVETGVTPGTYTNPEITLDEFGRATAVVSTGATPFPTSRTVYVDKAGSDVTGNGTILLPFLTINHALTTIMSGTSAVNQTVIQVNGGIYTEDNTAGPFAITSAGISLVGHSARGTLVLPQQPANALYSGSVNFTCLNMNFTSSAYTATCFTWSGTAYQLYFNNCLFRLFSVALTLAGSGPVLPTCLVDTCVFAACTTTITTTSCNLLFNDNQLRGTLGTTPSSSFNGILASGVSTVVYVSGATFVYCGYALHITTNARAVVNASNFIFSNQCVLADSAADVTLNASTFSQLDDVAGFGPQEAVNASDSSTVVSLSGCSFDGRNLNSEIKGIGVIIQDSATGVIQSCNFTHCAIGLRLGQTDNSDTSSTSCIITSCAFNLNTESVHLYGSDPANAPTLTGSTLAIDDSATIVLDAKANVKLLTSNTSSSSSFLNIGTLENADTSLITIATKDTNAPSLAYQMSLYGAESLCFVNPDAVSAASSTIAMLNASNNVLAGTTANEASLRLNTRNGGQTRGWRMYKDQPNARCNLAFTNEIAVGIGLQSETTYLQIDGTNNLVSLPTNAGALTFGASNDTSLSRASAGVLTTPGNVIVAGLTASRALTTNASKQLTSSATLDTELAFVNGVTSAIQTQLDSKLPLSAGASFPLSGALTIINGTGAAPGLNFVGSANTGVSFAAGAYQVSTAGVVRESIASSGAVTLSNLSTGVVHAGVVGLLTSSTIATIDIGDAQVTNPKLATVASANTPLYLVARDAGGEFQATMIQLSGTTTNATDVATKDYVDGKVATGLVFHEEVRLVAIADVPNIAAGTLPTIDGKTVVDGDRILLTNQTTANAGVDNGAWVAHDNPSPWVRPADFNAGQAGAAYFAVTEGNVYAGSAWVCSTPTAQIDVDSLSFALFSAPTTIAGSNLTTEEGLIFKNTTGTTLNFRSINQGAFALIDTDSTLADAVTIAVDATSANTASKVVARDASNNFAAGTITASLNGVANGNLANTGGTLSGGVTFTTGTFAAGSSAAPSINFTGSTTTGLSCGVADTLSFSVATAQVAKTDATNWFLTQSAYTGAAGVIHNDITTGRLTSTLIVNADIKSDAAIVDTKLATISTVGKVANTATTAVSAPSTALAIVARDASGNFSAGTITVSSIASATQGRVIIGNSATTSGTGSNQIAIGNAAQAGEGSSIAIGDQAIINTSTSGVSIAIGYGSAVSAVQNATCVGGITVAGPFAASASAFGYQCEVYTVGAVALGVTCHVSGTAGIAIGSSAEVTTLNAIALGQSLTNTTANSFLFGSSSIANFRPNNTGTCALGTTAARFSDAHLSGSIIGSSTTSVVNDLVSNSGTVTNNQVATFNGTTGRLITNGSAPIIGAASATSIVFTSTSGIIGTTTSDSAAAGSVGELQTASTTSQALTTNTNDNAVTLSLPAGDWDVWGAVELKSGGTTVTSAITLGVSTVSATLPAFTTGGLVSYTTTWPAGAGFDIPAQTVRVSLPSTSNVYIVVRCTFTTSTLNRLGVINARRVR